MRGKSRTGLRAAAALGAALLAQGCAINPVTGRPEMVLMSAEQEKRLGAAAAVRVEYEVGLIREPSLRGYVAELGGRVARYSPWQEVTYSFEVVDMEEPNAFSLPGGYVYVSRGLLALTNSEAELAGVLGHEIAHVAARHAVQRQTRAAGLGILALPGALVGAVVGPVGQVINAPIAVLGGGLLASYSRGQERQADEVGQSMCAEAGIDPAGIAVFLATLEAATADEEGEPHGPGFFDSHPSTPERVAAAGARAQKMAWTPQPGIAADRQAYLARLDGLVLGDDPAQGVFHDNLFLHPDMGVSLRFPEGWDVYNSARAAAAISRDRDATYVLELSGTGDDPRAAASSDLQRLAAEIDLQVVESGPSRIGSSSAFRAHVLVETRKGTAPLEICWVAWEGRIYRLTGASAAAKFEGYRPVFDRSTRSFRPITPAERDSIRVSRVRVVSAREGETLAQLSARSGNTWALHELAVANRLADDAILEAGRSVKVSREEPYVSPGLRARPPS